MSRRIYYVSAQKKKIRQEALLAMRQARRNLDPDLLSMAREAVAGLAARVRAQSENHAENHAENHDQGAESGAESGRAEPDAKVPVDRRKNMTIVMKYLEMTSDNKDLHRQIKAMLSE